MHPDASCTTRKEGAIVETILNSTNNNQYFISGKFASNNTHNEFPYIVLADQIFSGKTSIKKQKEYCENIIQLNTLTTKRLSKPIAIVIEYDEEYYIARSLDFPLYACGEDAHEAIQNLKDEIESVYFELREDDNFSTEWLNYKKLLNDIVLD